MKEKIVLAFSGGLDTSFCIPYLLERNYEVHTLFVDTGGTPDNEKQAISDRAAELGSTNHLNVNIENSLWDEILIPLIQAGALYQNKYPALCSDRYLIVKESIKLCKKLGTKNIAHGCTGMGNDQVRFDSIFQIINPHVKIITPIRDNNISRKQEISYLRKMGVKFTWNNSKYSINKGIWGTTIGGDETLTSYKALPNKAFTKKLIEKRKKVLNIKFIKGEIVSINNKRSNPIDLINYLEEISSQYAIGRDVHVGDTIIGIKGRVGFEAAAAKIIIKAHELLEKHTMSKWQIFQKESISKLYGMLIHEGQYFDPVIKDIEAYLEKSQRYVTGNVFVELSPYNFKLNGIKSKHDLMNDNSGVYGEENLNWSSDDIKGFIKINSNSSRIFKQINK